MAITPGPAAVTAPGRPALVRPVTDRRIAGVAAGLARHLGFPVRPVRLVLLGSSLVGGFGALLYLWLWALVPTEVEEACAEEGPPGGAPATDRTEVDAPRGPVPGVPPRRAGTPDRPAPRTGGREDRARRPRPRRSSVWPTETLLGVALLGGGFYLLLIRWGWGAPPNVVVPLLVVLVGGVVAFTQIDEVERLSGVEPGSLRRRSAVLRLIGGALLVALGVTLLVVQTTQDVAQMGRTLAAAVTVLGGTALVLAPWGVRLWRNLDLERASRAREAERAEIAAHLHDSVLQTLALIQRRSTDPAEVTRLARGQERDLRAWLYGGPPPDAESLAAAVEAVAADVEDLHGVAVDVVTVGDAALDERVVALISALREAIQNAVRHGAPPVRVYVEAGPAGIEAFVRDRGEGFDFAAVPEHRRGLRDSVVARMERHGGSATIRTAPGEATEVVLTLPPDQAGNTAGEEEDEP